MKTMISLKEKWILWYGGAASSFFNFSVFVTLSEQIFSICLGARFRYYGNVFGYNRYGNPWYSIKFRRIPSNSGPRGLSGPPRTPPTHAPPSQDAYGGREGGLRPHLRRRRQTRKQASELSHADRSADFMQFLFLSAFLPLTGVGREVWPRGWHVRTQRIKDQGSDQGSRIKGQGSDQGSMIKDQGSRIRIKDKDQGSRTLSSHEWAS